MSEPAHTDKLSVTIPTDLAEELRSRAGRGNVSAYVTHALVRQLEHDRLGDLLSELAAVHGPVTDEELARARAEWPES
ncbi:MAG TPA: hypothetical protein VGL05_01350 [Kribbella sp.]